MAFRLLSVWAYAARAAIATVLPGHPARIYWAHARQALFPGHGESIRDRAVREDDPGRGST